MCSLDICLFVCGKLLPHTWTSRRCYRTRHTQLRTGPHISSSLLWRSLPRPTMRRILPTKHPRPLMRLWMLTPIDKVLVGRTAFELRQAVFCVWKSAPITINEELSFQGILHQLCVHDYAGYSPPLIEQHSQRHPFLSSLCYVGRYMYSLNAVVTEEVAKGRMKYFGILGKKNCFGIYVALQIIHIIVFDRILIKI